MYCNVFIRFSEVDMIYYYNYFEFSPYIFISVNDKCLFSEYMNSFYTHVFDNYPLICS